jgi:membrane associated rhomboid family serine protease
MASVKGADANGGEIDWAEFEAPEGLVAVAVFDDFAKAGEAGLAILAMGDAYWMILHDACYVICVAQAREALVRSELAELDALAHARPRSATFEYQEFDFGWVSFGLFASVLIGVFIWQSRSNIGAIGQTDAVAMVGRGEWWRAVTALTLHADVVHLVSNLVAGMGFAFFVCRFFSASLGWLFILLSGIAGNVLNAQVYYPEAHYSIGASTAVFGALGLLTGVGVWASVSAPDRRLLLPRWLLPLFGGLTLLGLFGVGEGNVDVAAHISGFLCGVVLGGLGACYRRVFARLQRGRLVLGGLSVVIVAMAWGVAVAS